MTAKFVAFSCTHCPLEDPEAIRWLHRQIEDVKPDYVVHLGDLLEADGASRFPAETNWDLKDEFNAAEKLLKGLRSVGGPECTYVLLPGNHDDNILAQNRIDKRLRGLCDWRDLREMDNWIIGADYNYCRKRGVYRLGQVTFSHGYEANASAGKHEAVYLGNEYGLYVHGHTHRPMPVTQALMTQTRPLRFWYANAGTLADMDREYMKRKRKQLWGQACVVGEVQMIKSPRMSRCWSAETRIFRTFGDCYSV